MNRSLSVSLGSIAAATVLLLVIWFIANAALDLGSGYQSIPYVLIGTALALALFAWFADRRRAR